ncbi:MAG: hypothetical protein Nk1A_1050 [Endomicrobiia bacterium]|nr:MAG: hypothetical protein Nk1A_1050 [Endomicrobiia bacterium]
MQEFPCLKYNFNKKNHCDLSVKFYSNIENEIRRMKKIITSFFVAVSIFTITGLLVVQESDIIIYRKCPMKKLKKLFQKLKYFKIKREL